MVRRGCMFVGIAIMGMLAVVAIIVSIGTALLTGRSDSGPEQDQREAIVELIKSGELVPDEDGWVVLPDELSAASRSERGVRVWTDPALTVFFLTGTGFSPDPYCGYEYTEEVEPIVDPLHSGSNKELEALNDGWYWLCAS